uniref:Peptidase S1 domain-containing protein n=1 Tax=Glossina brevipalpis TaxID=37001 RepID=A0A1A9WHD6_9MUSC
MRLNFESKKHSLKSFRLTMIILVFLYFCGLNLELITCIPRVIGGQFATLGQFPHQVSLQLKGKHYCGGSLISENYVLTAAHCMTDQDANETKVIAGTVDLLAGDGVSFNVTKTIVHSQYNRVTDDYDICLLALDPPAQFNNSTVQKINLSDANINYAANTLATISGFGATNSDLQLPNKLKYAYVQLWGRNFCNPQNIPGITDRMICAGHPSGQINACQGDSGGPLTVDDKLFGIVSWGYGCGVRGKPAMYTYIGALRSWIKQNSGV